MIWLINYIITYVGGETDQNLPDNDTVFDVEHGEVNEEEADDDEDSKGLFWIMHQTR